MGEDRYQMFQDSISLQMNSQHHPWGNIEGDEDISDSMSSSFEDSNNSANSSSSSDLVEDASSSSTSYSSLTSSTPPQMTKGPLYELSELMAQLPIKRGLSKHFQGKSQSFTSLSNVKCLEDLAKRENPCKKRMKSCKSYAGIDANTSKSLFAPSKTISKKASSKRSSSLLNNKRVGVNNSPRSPLFYKKTFDV